MTQETSAFTTELEETGEGTQGSFILKFKTDRHFYVYDVNLNQVIELEPLAYALVHEYGVLSQKQIVEQYQHLYSPAEIGKAYQAIDKLHQSDGYFSCRRPKRVRFHQDAQSLRELYEEELQSLTLAITEQCNLRCDYCIFSGLYREQRQHSANRMTFETARKAVDFLHSHSRLRERVIIQFFGGEPLLAFPLIKKCVAYAKEIFGNKTVRFMMTTNGTLLSGAIRDFLVAHDFLISVSLDGPKELHDRHRRDYSGRGTFDWVCRNLEALRQAHPNYYRNNISFNCTVAPPYEGRVLDRFLKSSPLCATQPVRCGKLNNNPSTYFDQFAPAQLSEESIDRLYEEWLQCVTLSGSADKTELGPLLQGLRGETLEVLAMKLKPAAVLSSTEHLTALCVPGLERLFVDYRGRFMACEKVPASDPMCLGTVDEGIDVKKVMALAESCLGASKGCASCVVHHFCHLCFVYGIAGSKYDAAEKRRLCEDHIATWHKRLVRAFKLYELDPSAYYNV
jgi:uncharacterized protein